MEHAWTPPLDASHPEPRADLVWARDWAVLGGMTSGLAPLAVDVFLPLHLAAFAATAAVVGSMTGLLVGLVLHEGHRRVPRRFRVSFALVLAVPVLGLWGMVVGGVAGVLTQPTAWGLALPCGSLSALLQCAWLAPVYAWVASRGLTRFPLVLGAGLLTAPVCGFACVVAVMGVLGGFGWA